MISIDSNLLVRLATQDDIAARDAVVKLMQANEILISKTVLLECEWVLRSRFAYSVADFSAFMKYLASLPQVSFEDEAAVLIAMTLFDRRIDFADALHVASAGDRWFVTMDAVLARRGARLGANAYLLKRAG